VQVLTDPAPIEVLDFRCGFGPEFGVAGEFFANHLAGWVGIPISLTFLITVFVVHDLGPESLGCSMSVVGDYVVMDHKALLDNVALAHEIGHACGLWHSGYNGQPDVQQLSSGRKRQVVPEEHSPLVTSRSVVVNPSLLV
jgi:hypothetical protein